MKSRVLRARDYREVDVKPLLTPFAPDEAALEAELRRLTNPYIRWEAGETVSAGDQVVCRLVSDCPRFRKEKVRFVAGSGMFHKELENLSVGMSVDGTREIVLPEGRVALTLMGVMNRVAPEPGDEMVEKLGLDGVHTVAAYRAYLLEQQKQAEKLSGIRGEVSDIAWGNQIRSYVMQPYTMVKDHRTSAEVSNVDGVMDGKIDPFINAYLKWINLTPEE